MPMYKNKCKVVLIGGDVLLISQRDIDMLQKAADDWSREDIGVYFELSRRTVEKIFDDVRRGLGKRTFAAALVELHRKKVIE